MSLILQGDDAREQIDRIRFTRARRSITALAQATRPDYDSNWHHRAIAQAIEQVILYARFAGKRGGIPRLLISQPPQTGKSFHAAELGPSLALGQDPDLQVMATAYDSSLAGRAVENTRAIMTSPGYLATFPTRIGKATDTTTGRTIQAKDQASFFRTMREHSDGSVTPAQGYFYSAGITAGMTGWGFRLGIMDDWVRNEQAAISPTARLQRIGTYTKSFETRQIGPAGIVAISTMWDDPDWLDWLWETWTLQGHNPVWLRFPALSDDTCKYPLHPLDPRAPGSDLSLWESRFPTVEQRKKRAGLIVQDKNAWYALQQQNPLKIAGQLFPKTAWQWYHASGPNAFDLRQLDSIHMSIDGNVKETGSSYAVIGVYGVMVRMSNGAPVMHTFRLDESRGHYAFSMLRDETLRLWQKWRAALPDKVAAGRCWVEDKANGPALMSQLAGRGIPFHAVPKTRSKLSCYRMAQLPVLENRVWLPLDSSALITSDWVGSPTGFVSELAAQPKEPDDRADEFSQMIICNDPQLGIDLLNV
jgi:hypothetical protein